MYDSYPLDTGLNQNAVRFKLLYSWHARRGERFSLFVEASSDESIRKEESLIFILDGERVIFSSGRSRAKRKVTMDEFGLETNSWSVRHYEVNREFIDKLLGVENVLVTIKLDKTDLEADFASKNPNGAKVAIKKFMEKLKNCTVDHSCGAKQWDRRNRASRKLIR